MSTDTSTAASPSSTATTSNTDYCACVQYGFPDEKGPHREPKLRTIYEPIPDGANTASPIYMIPRGEYDRQDEFETGYEVKGGSSIAKEIQDECEEDDRVLCPVHIESDAYHDVGPETLISWFQEFVEDYLDVPFNTCTLYFSGNRSIHVHVPRFVSGEDNREQLKELAESFCEEAGADLDLGLYSRKRLFRLPGVEHEKSGLSKVEIEPMWEKDRIFRESYESSPDLPATYSAVLRRVFASHASLTRQSAQPSADEPHGLFRVLDPEKTVLEFDTEEREIETPLIEQREYPSNSADAPEWLMYNAKEFSPYAHAHGNPRSVAVVEVKGGAFARKGTRNGAPMVPAWFIGAIGCDGSFTKEAEHAPLQLSEGDRKDFEKWSKGGYQKGDYVVVVGGQSRSSVIFSVTRIEALQAGYRLISTEGSRKDALDYLSSQGYDVGASGSTGTIASREGASTTAATIYPARENQGGAEALQRKAEREGIGTLSHNERIRVACRLLRYGWEPTWEWFEERFGSSFKPKVTHRFLKGIAEESTFQEYNHIDVPDSPP